MTNDQNEIPYSDLPEDWLSTAEDMLRFAIHFCQEDLAKMRPGDLLNLREDLGFFMYGHPASEESRTPAGIMSFDDFTLTEAPVEKLSELQKEVYEVLNLAASWDKPINPRSLALNGPLPKHQVTVGLDLRGDLIGAHGSSRDCFLFILYHLLVQEKNAVKKICLCPGCGRIFYRMKKQKYCSSRCTNRVYMQQYRAKNGEKTAEANHKQYERRTKAKTGKAVKIARRSRK